MYKKILLLIASIFVIASCQFTETMIMEEDGSGTMSIVMDMSEMMAFGGLGADTTEIKMDTIVYMKQFLEEKKDSIAQLSEAEQERLKRMENFNLRLFADSDTNEMLVNVFTNFSSIEEANDIINGLGETSNFVSGVGDVEVNKDESSSDVMGVTYSFANGTFIRDAFVKDTIRHQQQVDSIGSMEAFLSNMKYKLKYTFPKKIKNTSNENATFSLDGKTIEVEAAFIEYIKNPDLLDLNVELEN